MDFSQQEKRILVTGGVGFIGHHFVEHLLRLTKWSVWILDCIDCSSTIQRLTDILCWEREKHRVRFIWHDLQAPISSYLERHMLPDGERFDFIVHLAAMSHVDRSIESPLSAAMNNVVGSVNILEFARRRLDPAGKFVYFSTDEVFGPAPVGVKYREWDRYNSSNPYSAAKAGGEEMAIAFANTYKVPTLITHTMNVFGERQHPEKFIIMAINRILRGETIPIHSDSSKKISGSRFYIHARNVAATVIFLLEHGECLDGSSNRGKYNIVGEEEISNLALVELIGAVLDREVECEMVDFHSLRPGHDLRYALDGGLVRSMGWEHPRTFRASLAQTVHWMINRPEWLGSQPN
jgi:dTDP-glucose 4,6-dehydratase